MLHRIRLALGLLCTLCSSIVTFNTGASLNNIGKAKPATIPNVPTEYQTHKQNNAVYREVMAHHGQPHSQAGVPTALVWRFAPTAVSYTVGGALILFILPLAAL